ncbi:hypothetical protein [Pandoraea bronchicola]|uniref:hypothetical protein n=1 Tax=Pandoraea bronchicola TaxID=2508287 RepID=UPI001241A292|nr:hypothetical protein [Pandoraea bronchicola]
MRSEDQLRHIAAWCGRSGRPRAGPHFGAQQPQSLCNETSEAHFTCGERDLHLMSLAVGQRANQTIVSSPVNRFLDIPDAHHFTPILLCQVSGHFGKRRIPGQSASNLNFSPKLSLKRYQPALGGHAAKFNVEEERPPFVPQIHVQSALRWCAATLPRPAPVLAGSPALYNAATC